LGPRDGRVSSAPPPPRQPVSLVLSRHRRTNVMAMKDALGGWSGGGPMHAQRSTPAHWVAVPQCQPTNAVSRRGHIRTTLTTGPASLPHPATRTSLPDTGAWTVARNCPIAQVMYVYIIHQQCCALRRPFPANPLSQAVPPTWISTTPPGRRRRCLFL